MTFVHDVARGRAARWLRDGHDVVLRGDAGSGRSTLLGALAESLRAAGTPVVEVDGTAAGDAVPLGAMLTHPALRSRTNVARWGPTEACAALAGALDGRGCVLVDDVHLMDPASLAVLDSVARRDPAVRLVAAVPDGVPDVGPWSDLVRGAVTQRVEPLGVSSVAELLAGRLGGQVEGGLAVDVARRTAGNPRAVVLLAGAAVAAGAVRQVHGRWSVVTDLEVVPTSGLLHGLLGGVGPRERDGLEMLAWYGLLTVDLAARLVGHDVLADLDRLGRVAVDEHPAGRLVTVSPPVLGQALRASLSGVRRSRLRERAEALFDDDRPGDGTVDLRLAPAVGTAAPEDRSVHQQVTIVTESARTRTAGWYRTWRSRHDLASALPLLRLHLVDGTAGIDPDVIFRDTVARADDDPEDVAAFVVLRARWTELSGGTFDDGLLHDPGASGLLVPDRVSEVLLRDHDGLEDAPRQDLGPTPDPAAVPLPRVVRAYGTILRVRAAIETGAPDRALEILGPVDDDAVRHPYAHWLDSLRGDALLMVGQVEDALTWARGRLIAAYTDLSPFGIRLAARGLASAAFVRGDDDRALRALGVALQLGRSGPLHGPFDERVFALAAVLNARVGNHALAATLLDELDATPRPYRPLLDFMRPWARLEVEAASGRRGVPDGEELWSTGEELWAEGWRASALFSWAFTPQRLSAQRLDRLGEALAATRVPLLTPVLRLHRSMARGSSADVLAAARAVGGHGTLVRTAFSVARSAAQDGSGPTSQDLADLAEQVGGGSAGSAAERSGPLTSREEQVVALAREGLTNREIASRLYLSVRTVESHLYRAMQKLGVSDRRSLTG